MSMFARCFSALFSAPPENAVVARAAQAVKARKAREKGAYDAAAQSVRFDVTATAQRMLIRRLFAERCAPSSMSPDLRAAVQNASSLRATHS